MKNILIIVIFLQSNIFINSQELIKCEGRIDYSISRFQMNNIQPLIGDTLIAPLKVKVNDHIFKLDDSKSKRFVIDSLRFIVNRIVNRNYEYFYDGNEIVDYDYCKYSSSVILYIRCLDSPNISIGKIINVESDHLTKDNKNRKFIVIYKQESDGVFVEFKFKN